MTLVMFANKQSAHVLFLIFSLVLLYGRSHCLPQFLGGKTIFTHLVQSPHFFLDILYTHEVPSDDNKCEVCSMGSIHSAVCIFNLSWSTVFIWNNFGQGGEGWGLGVYNSLHVCLYLKSTVVLGIWAFCIPFVKHYFTWLFSQCTCAMYQYSKFCLRMQINPNGKHLICNWRKLSFKNRLCTDLLLQ